MDWEFLEIKNVSQSDAGGYKCILSSNTGWTTQSMWLTVKGIKLFYIFMGDMFQMYRNYPATICLFSHLYDIRIPLYLRKKKD